MEINNIEKFVSYCDKTRAVTKQIVAVIPPDRIDWTYMPGKFSIGDLIRHIAAIERHVFAEIASGNKSKYRGCGRELADGYENVVAYFDRMHHEAMAILESLSTQDLDRKIRSVDGKEVLTKNFLRAMIVHEIHHRGALCIYLNLLRVTTPQIMGLTEAEVKFFSTSGV